MNDFPDSFVSAHDLPLGHRSSQIVFERRETNLISRHNTGVFEKIEVPTAHTEQRDTIHQI